MGDVAAMLEFFTHALADKGVATLEESIATLLQSPSIPSHLPLDTLKNLPQSPGVYRFYGENDALLYVGKSINIAQRVASHFSGDHNTNKSMRISQSLHRVEYTETAGELGALLLELRQIKTLNPLFNRRSRAAKNLVSIELAPNDSGYLQARLVREVEPQRLASYFGLFRSKRDAAQALSGIAAKNDLCNQLLGLEPERRSRSLPHRTTRRECAGCADALSCPIAATDMVLQPPNEFAQHLEFPFCLFNSDKLGR